MKSPTRAVAQFRFSTRAFSKRERLAAWRDVVSRTVVDLDVEPAKRGAFFSEATICQLPELGVLWASSSPVHLNHPRAPTGSNDLTFIAATTCPSSVSQLGRRLELGPGDGVLLTNDESWSATFAAAARFTLLRVPASAIRLPDVAGAVARLIPAGSVALQLLASYLVSLLDSEALIAPELTQLAGAHVYDLLAATLRVAHDGAEIDSGRGRRAARLNAIKADILAHLGERNLSLAVVAARHGISPVYVRKLLESEGSSFSALVLEERLARVHRILSDPRLATRPIGAIAMEAGFGDLSYFNRAFRRRFGTAPSDVRAAAIGER